MSKAMFFKYTFNHKSVWLLLFPELGASLLKNVWFFLGSKFYSFFWRLGFSQQWDRHFICLENCTISTCLHKAEGDKYQNQQKTPQTCQILCLCPKSFSCLTQNRVWEWSKKTLLEVPLFWTFSTLRWKTLQTNYLLATYWCNYFLLFLIRLELFVISTLKTGNMWMNIDILSVWERFFQIPMEPEWLS